MRPVALTTLTVMLVVSCAAAAIGSISGFVRGSDGKPVAGAIVIVTAKQDGTLKLHTVTQDDGSYRIQSIGLGEFQVSLQSEAATTLESHVVRLSAEVPSGVVDFVKPATVPQFQAAGLHGLIDPGGYSAPANAAASDLVKGLAHMESAGSGASADVEPCSLEGELAAEVAHQPQSPAANLRLGSFYASHGETDKALPYLETARQLDPGSYGTSRELAAARIAVKQFEAAHDLLSAPSALASNRNDAEFHVLLARADEGLGRFQPAAGEYQAAAQIQSTEENLFGVGYELILAGSAASARDAFTAGLKRYSHSAKLLIGLGTVEFLLGENDRAVHSLLSAVDSTPTNPSPYPFLLKAFLVSGAESERVRRALQHYVELAPASGEAAYLYATALLHNASNDDLADASQHAETLLQRAVKLDPELADAHVQLAALCLKRGDSVCAEDNYQAAAKLAPAEAEPHYRLATLYKQAGKQTESEKELQTFRQIRATSKDQPGGLASIAQFISVFQNGGQPGNTALSCSVH